MRRRNLLAAIGGAGGLGVGAWYVRERRVETRIPSVAVHTLDATGSTSDTVQVPEIGTVTVLDVFSIGCPPCKTETRRINEMRNDFGADVHLVSVTNDAVGGTLTRDDIRQWWHRNDGNWPVGLDHDGRLMRELGVTGLPTVAVIDTNRRLAWKHAGLVPKQTLLDVVNGLETR